MQQCDVHAEYVAVSEREPCRIVPDVRAWRGEVPRRCSCLVLRIRIDLKRPGERGLAAPEMRLYRLDADVEDRCDIGDRAIVEIRQRDDLRLARGNRRTRLQMSVSATEIPGTCTDRAASLSRRARRSSLARRRHRERARFATTRRTQRSGRSNRLSASHRRSAARKASCVRSSAAWTSEQREAENASRGRYCSS